ncbi:MAG: hypothetical protein EXR92_01990 [Gemmatimonadetes bacterium]|nr:hypothetical protein [Gemmatimonadota bacterium]
MRESKQLFRVLMPMVLAAAAAGCGGGDSGGGGAPAASEGAAAPAAMPFDVATAGNVSGMVMFEGTAPAPAAIDMASEATCAAKHTSPPTTEDFKVAGGHLGDVFIYVRSGPTDGMTFPVPAEAAVIDQSGCQYVPHVTGVQVGQTLTFRNSDGVLHNVSASPTVNRPFNIGQPGAVRETNRTLTSPEIMVPLRCQVHGWMNSFVGVTANPYQAVSSEGGTFDLRNLPPGQYVVEAWHSRLGTQQQTVTVTTGQTAQITFTFTQAMIASAVVPMGAPLDPHDHGPVAMGTGSTGEHVHGAAAAAGS